MAVTVSELGARVLRRLGVAAVAASDRPSITTTTTTADIATRALQALGIIVPESERPTLTATSTVTDIAARTLSTLGIVVPASERPTAASNVTVADVAARALQRLAVTVPEVDRPANTVTVTATELVNQALQSLGVTVPFAEWPVLTSSVTVTDVARGALDRLGVVASDETPSTADTAHALAAARVVHDALVLTASVTWAETAIPRAWANDYAKLAAIELAASYGHPQTGEFDPAMKRVIEERIRLGHAVTRATPAGGGWLVAVHTELVGIGAASWQIDAIPWAVADEYVELLRQNLAPMLNVKIAPVERAVLEERVRRVARVKRAQSDAVATVTAVHDGLARRGLASWATSAIPAGVREPLSGLVAVELASGFGIAADRGVVAEFEAQVGRVASLIRSQAQAEAAVNAAHEGLVSRGYVSWAANAIPRSVSEEYVIIARFDLGPAFGVQVDPATVSAAELRIGQVSRVARAKTLAEARVAAVHESLSAAGLVSFAGNAIPRALSEEFAQLVAMDVGPALGVQVDRSGMADLEARVRRMSLLLGGPAIAERAVLQVHADLTARGKTRWTISDLPTAAERPYVVLAANSIAYEFQVPPDQLGGAQALVDLARLISLPSSGERVVAEYF